MLSFRRQNLLKIYLAILGIISLGIIGFNSVFMAQVIPPNYPLANPSLTEIEKIAQLTSVRLLTPTASGSGVIVNKQGKIYTVITNWHTVSFAEKITLITPDKKSYSIQKKPQKLGDLDLAILQFMSDINYSVVQCHKTALKLGDRVFASGFPMYQSRTIQTTFNEGIKVFRFTEGTISLLPNPSLEKGYDIGYTNDIVIGMSGGPILDNQGLLIGINGRVKNRDPDFGVYVLSDGSEPPINLRETMLNSSWGINISNYLKFTQNDHEQ